MSSTRIFGLSGSGMDIDTMVKDMMKARRAAHDTMWQKKTQLEWKKADYNSMYTTIRDFRSTTAFNYKLQGTVQPKTVTSSAENLITATANADAVNVSHDINVTQLAEGARLTSTTSLGSGEKTSLRTQFGLTSGETFQIKLNGQTIDVNTNNTINDLVSSINNAKIGVKASYDANVDRFFLTTTATGEDAKIDFTGTTDTTALAFLEGNLKLNIRNDANEIVARVGKNAQFDLDGALGLEQTGNTFSIAGVTYNLKAKGAATVSVLSDNTKAVDAVKTFVQSYNTLLDKINSEVKEQKYAEYLPLTKEQKKEMSETEVADWEKLAKSGSLRRDPLLQDTLIKLRSNVSAAVSGLSGNYSTLAAIGITTGDYSEAGKLYLDETKLKSALEADPEVISKLFSTSATTSSQQGVAVRIYDTLKVAMDKIASTAGRSANIDDDSTSFLAKRIIGYNKSLDTLLDKLENMEDRYYKQFTAMEKALSKMNQQSSWLTQQFSS